MSVAEHEHTPGAGATSARAREAMPVGVDQPAFDLGDDIGSLRWYAALFVLCGGITATIALGLTATGGFFGQLFQVDRLYIPVDTAPERLAALPIGPVSSRPLPLPKIMREIAVERGDTLAELLVRGGADRREVHAITKALQKHYDPRRMQVGQLVKLTFAQASPRDRFELSDVTIRASINRDVHARRADDGFNGIEVIRPLQTIEARAAGRIDSSLFVSAEKAGLPADIIVELIRMFSFDVDFQREIRAGDSFEVLFERLLDEDGRPAKSGNILFASLTLSGRTMRLYRFVPPDDQIADYFNEKGHTARKALMKTPIDGARLSSHFGPRRHPILGYTRIHRGTDFAASSGTPIMAAGNGVVVEAGRNGGYGNYVRIRHNGEYQTAYAHMSRFARGIRKGARVRQGQTIGYVGSTGRSTGPHLHYEVFRSGTQVNPMKLKLPTG